MFPAQSRLGTLWGFLPLIHMHTHTHTLKAGLHFFPSSSQKVFSFLSQLKFCYFYIPCSCTLTCCKASGCARDPAAPRWLSPQLQEYSWGTDARLPGLLQQLLRKSLSCTSGTLTAMIHSTAEACRFSWATRKYLIFLCFGMEAADCVGNLCPRPILALLMVPDHAGLGRVPLPSSARGSQADSCKDIPHTAQYNQSHAFSSTSLYLGLS